MTRNELYNMVVRLGGDATGLHSSLANARASLSSTAAMARAAGSQIESATRPPSGIFSTAWSYLTGSYRNFESAAGGVEKAQKRVGAAFSATKSDLEEWEDWDMAETVEGFNLTINEFKSGWGLFAAAMTGGIFGLVGTFIANFSKVASMSGEWWDDVDEGVTEIIDGIRDKLQKLFEWAVKTGGNVLKVMGQGLEALSHVLSPVVETAGEIWEELQPVFKTLQQIAAIGVASVVFGFTLIFQAAGKILDALGGIEALWEAVTEAASSGLGVMGDLFDQVAEWFTGTAIDRLQTAFFSFLAGAGLAIVAVYKFWEAIGGLSGAIDLLVGFFQNLWQVVTGLFSAWNTAVPALKAGADAVLDVGSGAREAAATVYELDLSLRAVFAITGFLTASVVGLYIAYRALAATIALLHGVYTLLHIRQLAVLALTGLWKIVIVSVNAVVWVFNAALATWNLLMAAGSALVTAHGAASAAWGAVLLVVKGAVWLLNAALTALNVLLAPATVFALVVTLGTLVTVLGSAYVLITSIWAAGTAVFDIISKIESSPLSNLTAAFGDWYVGIQLAVRALNTDFKLAWEIFLTTANLAINQLQDLWPGAWHFIKRGFDLLWDTVIEIMGIKFRAGFGEIFLGLFGSLENLPRPLRNFLGITDEEFQTARDAVQAGTIDVERALRNANRRFGLIAEESRAMFRESGITAGIRAELNNLRRDLAEAEFEKYLEELLGSWDEVAASTNNAADGLARVYRELHRFDATASGSAEAIQRLTNTQLNLIDQLGFIDSRRANATTRAATTVFDSLGGASIRDFARAIFPGYGAAGPSPFSTAPGPLPPPGFGFPGFEGPGGPAPGAFGTPEHGAAPAPNSDPRPTETNTVLRQIRDALIRGFGGAFGAPAGVGADIAAGGAAGAAGGPV